MKKEWIFLLAVFLCGFLYNLPVQGYESEKPVPTKAMDFSHSPDENIVWPGMFEGLTPETPLQVRLEISGGTGDLYLHCFSACCPGLGEKLLPLIECRVSYEGEGPDQDGAGSDSTPKQPVQLSGEEWICLGSVAATETTLLTLSFSLEESLPMGYTEWLAEWSTDCRKEPPVSIQEALRSFNGEFRLIPDSTAMLHTVSPDTGVGGNLEYAFCLLLALWAVTQCFRLISKRQAATPFR